jgi:ParB family chromosome partitioning protein
MKEIRKISIADILRNADQYRTYIDPEAIATLAKNMREVSQLVPVIVYVTGNKYTLLDGERRWRAAELIGIKELDAVVLAEKPTATALHVLQMSLEVHKVGHSPMDLSNLLTRIREENNWNVIQTADNLGMKQSQVSKLLSYQRLAPEIKEQLHAGKLDCDKAYTISQEADPVKQLELIKQAGGLTREQLRRKAHSNGEPVELKAKVARFPLSSNVLVTVQGQAITLTGAIDALLEVVKELKHGQRTGLDVVTASAVMRDKAKAGGVN